LRSKLILIEGLPGSGKSGTTAHLGESLLRNGISCSWFLEDDENHPIDLSDFALKDISMKLLPLWESFVRDAQPDQGMTIMESRLWQNTSLFMYMAEYPFKEIVELQDRVNEVLAPLSPILIYLYQPDITEGLRHLHELRDESSLKLDLEMTSRYSWFQSRGKDDFAGWLEFFNEWFEVAEVLYDRWPYNKCKIENPHDNWDLAHSKINEYLRITNL
jgi:hypothetical protein